MTKLEKMGRAYALEHLLNDFTISNTFEVFKNDLREWVENNEADFYAHCFCGKLEIIINVHRHFFTVCGFEEFLEEFGFYETTTTFGTDELWEIALEYFGIVAE